MANKKIDYNSINFKNKDVDKFSTKFGKDDPGKGLFQQISDVKDALRFTAGELKNEPRIKKRIEEEYQRNSENGKAYEKSYDQAGKELRQEALDKLKQYKK